MSASSWMLEQQVVETPELAIKLTELEALGREVKHLLPVQWCDAEHPEYNTFHTQSVTHWLVIHTTE
jgi:hypothetical protein